MCSLHRVSKFMKCLLMDAIVTSVPSVTFAQHYTQKNPVSNIPQPDNPDGSKVLLIPTSRTPEIDPVQQLALVGGNNNSGTATLYDGNGKPINIFPIRPAATSTTLPSFPRQVLRRPERNPHQPA